MAFTKDDREYIKDTVDTAIKPVKESVVRLEEQFDKHDDETKTISDTQQRMIGAWNIIKYSILPIVVGVAVWFFTKA